MCKGSQTTTSSSQYSPNPQALGAYSNLISQAQGVAGTPYIPYTGELVAPVNPQESAGIGNVNAAAQFSLPSSLAGLSLAEQASQPINASQIAQYESPFTQQVVNATQQQFNNQNAQQMAQVRGNAIAQGAMGGNREAIAEAELANQQQLAQAPVIAGLEQTGYQTGLNTALTEQQAQLMGGYGVAGIGTAAQNALLSGAGQQIGAGQLQQTTQQAVDAAAYQQYLNRLAYPFQTNQWLAGILGSVGPQMGGSGTGQTTGPAPSILSQIGGLGTLATGLGGSSGLLSALPFIGAKSGGRITAEGVAKRDMGGGMLGMEGYPSGYPMGVAGGVQSAPVAPYRPSGSSYVPASNLAPAYPFSWRLPTPPSLPSGDNPSTVGKGLAELAQGVFGKNGKDKGKGDDGGIDTSFTPSAEGDTLPVGTDPEVDSLGPIYRRGGGVHFFADGGGELGELMPPPIDLSGSSNPADPAGVNIPPDFSGPPSAADIASLQPHPEDTDSVPLPRSRPPGLGVAAPPMSLESSAYNAPQPYDQNDITRWQHSIGGIESGNNYSKVGPVTRTGDQAYGRYQIMGNNIPSWTQQILGKAMTPQQFLANPDAQDAVFRAKFGSYVDKYGLEGAGRAWYAGENGMNNLGATAHAADGRPIGVTVADYGQRFLRGLGVPVGDVRNSANTLPANSQPTQGPAPNGQSSQDQPGQGVAGGQGFLQKLFPNVDFSPSSKLWPALIAAGAGMMSSRSPFPGVAIGEGATAGLNEYQYEKAAEQASTLKQRELDMNSQRLQQAADQFALNYQVSLQRLKTEQDKEAREAAKPVEYSAGVDPWTGQPVKGYAVKNNTGLYVDTQSGKPVASLNGTRQPVEAAAGSAPPPVAGGPVPPVPQPAAAPAPTRSASAEPGPLPNPQPAPGPGPAAPVMPGNPAAPNAAPGAPAAPQVTMTPARGQLRPALPYNPVMLPAGVDAATVDPRTGIGKDGRDYAYLQSIQNPDAAGAVLGLVNYQIDPTSLGYRGMNRGKVMSATTIFDPNYHQEWFKDIASTEGSFGHGDLGKQTRFFQNAVEHQQTLLDYAKAMNNGDIRLMNRIKNTIGVQFGVTAPNTFEGLRQLVAGEVIKAATGAQGALGDREDVAKSFNSSASLPQLISLLQGFQDLGGAQLFHLETQFQSGTHDQRGDFAKYMHLDKASTDQLRRQEARDATARGGLQTYATPEAVQQAIKDKKLHPGDKFLRSDGMVGTVPSQ